MAERMKRLLTRMLFTVSFRNLSKHRLASSIVIGLFGCTFSHMQLHCLEKFENRFDGEILATESDQ
jgi:hypothetical protein